MKQDQKTSDQLEDFSRTRVPEDRTVGGTEIALIIVGIFIALPAFLAGSQIIKGVGLVNGSLAIIAGAAILTLVGCFIAVIAATSRLSTYMIMHFPFGRLGARLVSLLIGSTLLGWYGVNASLFGRAMQTAMEVTYGTAPGLEAQIAIGSLLVIVTAIVGFRAIDRLARAAVPLLLIALLGILYYSTRQPMPEGINDGSSMTLGLAVSAVVGAFMVGLTLLPDLLRYARTAKHGLLAVLVGVGLGYPMVLITSAVPTLATGQTDFLLIMTGLGMGISAIAIVVFATWTTNISNLYSASLLLTTVFTGVPRWILTVIAGVIGTVVAGAGIVDNFIGFLVFLSAAIPPIAGIYIADFFLIRGRSYDLALLAKEPAISWPAFTAWIGASIMGLAASSGRMTLSTIPALDSLVLAFGLYAVLMRFWGRR